MLPTQSSTIDPARSIRGMIAGLQSIGDPKPRFTCSRPDRWALLVDCRRWRCRTGSAQTSSAAAKSQSSLNSVHSGPELVSKP